MQSCSISLSLISVVPAQEILYMQGEQGLRRLLLQPRAIQREVTDLLSLSVEQKCPRGWW